MARKFPRPQSIAEWVKNPFVKYTEKWSVLVSGYWHSPLKFPISSDRKYCLEANQVYADWKYRDLLGSTSLIEELANPAREIADGILFLGSSNHYHYLIDGLGSLQSEFFSTHRKIFIDSEFSEDQFSFLKAYISVLTPFYVEVVRIERGTYSISNVIVPLRDNFNSCFTRLRFNLNKLAPSSAEGASKIYVSRGEANTRRLVNENEIIESLVSKYGFTILSNERLTLMQQLKFYRNSKVVIGTHGAGLTNSVFMRDPHAIVDIWHSLQQPFFRHLASSLNAAYIPIEGNPCCDMQLYPLGSGYAVTSRPDNEDCWVEMNLITQLLAPLLKNVD